MFLWDWISCPQQQSHPWIHHCRYLVIGSIIKVTPEVTLTTSDLKTKTPCIIQLFIIYFFQQHSSGNKISRVTRIFILQQSFSMWKPEHQQVHPPSALGNWSLQLQTAPVEGTALQEGKDFRSLRSTPALCLFGKQSNSKARGGKLSPWGQSLAEYLRGSETTQR